MLASSDAGQQRHVIGMALAVERLVAGIVRHGDEEDHAEQDERGEQCARPPRHPRASRSVDRPLIVMTSV